MADLCFCDKQGLGEPNVSCGDCPTRDYKPNAAPNDLEISEAVHAAAAAIHFDDSSNYLSALWTVLRKLAPGVAEVLENNPRQVFDEDMNLRVPAAAKEDQRASDEPGAWTCKGCGFRGFWSGGLHCDGGAKEDQRG